MKQIRSQNPTVQRYFSSVKICVTTYLRVILLSFSYLLGVAACGEYFGIVLNTFLYEVVGDF